MARFGSPKYGGNFKPSPRNCKEGETLILRILPPILSCVESGEWAVAHTQHFGYDTANPNDSSKRIFNTFYCVEKIRWENGTKVIVQSCPEDDKIAQRKADYESRKLTMVKEGKSEEEIRDTLQPLVKWLMRHNRDFKWYINVKDDKGEFFTLRVPNKTKKQIDEINKTFRDRKPGIDPIAADQGLWLSFCTTGKNFQKETKVEVCRETKVIDGESFEKVKLAPLNDLDAERAENCCWDLHHVGIRALSWDKVKMLVDSGGDEDVIRSIFKSSERNEISAEASPDPADLPTEEPVQPPPPPVVEEDDEVSRAMKALAEAKARKEAAKTVVTPPVVTTQPKQSAPQTTSASVPASLSDIDDDEAFLAQFR